MSIITSQHNRNQSEHNSRHNVEVQISMVGLSGYEDSNNISINNNNSSSNNEGIKNMKLLIQLLKAHWDVLFGLVVVFACFCTLLYWIAVMDTPHMMLGFEVDSLGVNSLTIFDNRENPSKHILTATNLNLTLTMKIKKNTKVESPLLVLVEYHGEIFSTTMVQPSVFQHTQNQSLALDMDVTSSTQLSQGAIDSIAKDLASHNDLEFTVLAQGRNWVLKGWDAKYAIKVICKGIKVRFPSNITTSGKMINASIPCKFKFNEIPSTNGFHI